MSEKKAKKDEYQKALAAFGLAMKDFRKGDMDKASTQLEAFLEKYAVELELADRARMYLEIARRRPKKETAPLKTFEDHVMCGIYRIHQENFDEAAKILNKALDFKTDEGRVHYLLAQVSCLTGNDEDCLEQLKTAIQKDKFLAVLAQNDRDFEPVWEDKRFKVLVKLA